MPPNPSNETWLSIPAHGDWESPILRNPHGSGSPAVCSGLQNLKPYLEVKPWFLPKVCKNPSACVCLCISLACWHLQAVSFLGASSKKVDWQEHQPMLEMTSHITRPWKYGSFFSYVHILFPSPMISHFWIHIFHSLSPKCSISTSAAHSNILFFTKHPGKHGGCEKSGSWIRPPLAVTACWTRSSYKVVPPKL